MPKQPDDARKPWGWVIVAVTAGLILTITLGAAFGWLRYVGTVVLGALAAVVVLILAFWDAIDAWFHERAVEANPEDVYSEDIGRTVTAMSDFASDSSTSTGKVSLGGETWSALCESGHLPRKGDKLVVERRDGLSLVVAPVDDQRHLGPRS